MDTNIEQFLLRARNKLVVTTNFIDDILYIDLGSLYSQKLNEIKFNTKFSIRSKFILDSLLTSIVLENNSIGKYIALKNIGILFEPELKIDLLAVLDKFSKDYILVLQWEGEIENNNLYFLTKEKGKKINIKNLSHIII